MSSTPSLPSFAADELGRGRRILVVGINYEPEKVGIGPYTAEMAKSLVTAGFSVEAITAKPYYPDWRIHAGHRGLGYARADEGGVRLTRCPLYVPRVPTGLRRILHHLSFALAITPPLLSAALRRRPALAVVIAPSMMSAPVVQFFGRLSGARLWMHIQDFEIAAAFATGLIASDSPSGRAARRFESIAYRGFDYVSSISPQMCQRLLDMGIPGERVFELRNWTSVDEIAPIQSSASSYRLSWGIERQHVALYSGNISNKQGLETIIDAAALLQDRQDLLFVICGDGPQKKRLAALAAGLTNVLFQNLQPREHLNELLGLASVHLLPQIAGAADLVLPSKLTNMLASGKPVVATADPGTGLADEVDKCGVVVKPGDPQAMAQAIATLIDDEGLRRRLGDNGRARAAKRWSKTSILSRLAKRISGEMVKN